MTKLRLIILTVLLSLATALQARVSDPAFAFVISHPEAFSANLQKPDDNWVVVRGDTIPGVLRSRNLGRHDRGLTNYLFIPKNSWMFGLTASYGELSTSDIEILSFLSDIDISGKSYSIKPSVSWFFNHNQSVGMKIIYSRSDASVGSFGLDIGEDMNFRLRDVRYMSESYAVALAYRNYVGIDRRRRFAVFNEADLSAKSGHSIFSRIYAEAPKDTRTDIKEVSLNFSPGVCIFMMENVNFSLSFGVFGLKWRNEKQQTNGVDEGSRTTSGANFRFNIFNLNFGLGIVI